jgi:hypothetical protein
MCPARWLAGPALVVVRTVLQKNIMLCGQREVCGVPKQTLVAQNKSDGTTTVYACSNTPVHLVWLWSVSPLEIAQW